MASHSDEEALDSLIDAHQPEQHQPLARPAWKILIGSALCLTALALGYRWTAARDVSESPVPVAPSKIQVKSSVGDAALGPAHAVERNEKRQRMVVEENLETILAIHVGRKSSNYQGDYPGLPEVCSKQAGRLFDAVVEDSAMEKELNTQELAAFKDRFTAAMLRRCKDAISERLWLKFAGEELERSKPVMTTALAAALNSADLGFEAKMHDWLLHESAETFQGRLGMLPTPAGQKDILKRNSTGRQAGRLPRAFRAELKWPQCREAILRIHNQGHCGSCWAFGALASVDARMCIASGHWEGPEEILSRLHVTSCTAEWAHSIPGADGCAGGYPHWVFAYMANTAGIASTSCLPYYIGGAGSEHFAHSDKSPPCETHCQGGYSLPLADDKYTSTGVGQYDWLSDVFGDHYKIQKMKSAMYDEGPVAFAFNANHAFMGYTSGVFSVCYERKMANHAVYAFGWGRSASAYGGDSVEYIEASNSWDVNWGNGGHFRISPDCITDVFIPGSIESGVVGHSVGTVDPTVPKDPDNEFWPWAPQVQCPYRDGCITDVEGEGADYSENEYCTSNALNGKAIRVVEFDVESNYDTLTVNGQPYTGSSGPDGVVVDDKGIKFEADGSVNSGGFKICDAR